MRDALNPFFFAEKKVNAVPFYSFFEIEKRKQIPLKTLKKPLKTLKNKNTLDVAWQQFDV